MGCTVFYMNRRATEELCLIIRAHLPQGWNLTTPTGNGDYSAGLASCDFILVADEAILAEHIAAAPRLRMIQHQGVGYERIDLEACRSRGIPVALTPEGTRVGVAEHTLLLILAVYKHLLRAATGVREGRWMQWKLRNTSFELYGKNLGLVGLGGIGREVAKRAQAFDARITYYDPQVSPPADLLVTRRESLESLLGEADLVSLHVPLSPRNRQLINSRTLGLMKPGAVLINTSRGGLVDEAALVEALAAGRIAAAALDVLNQEPPDPANPLLHLENVLITPHIAAGTRDALENKMQAAFANLLRYSRGEAPVNVVPELRDLIGEEQPCHSTVKN
ncbi:MAG: NAD(P)-binding domain-containing protein [Acidobacteria bacterium]|nr:NAD(P)-binding domain-containing protein [Acidobacteriota bacterium]MCI0722678.1 NAD(P)-binding domain-containing protein [Acidobacteriota bacterium]